MIERVYIAEAAKQLDYKTNKSFRSWCSKNDVAILFDKGCRKKYVLKPEFETAKMQETIKYLIQKYGVKELPRVLDAYANFRTEYIIALNEKTKDISYKQEYKQMGHHEKSMLAILTSQTPEL
jgi:hypothetical protein